MVCARPEKRPRLAAALALSKAPPVVAVRTSGGTDLSCNLVKTAGRRFRRLCAGAPSPTGCPPVRWAARRVSWPDRRSAVRYRDTSRRADRAPGRCWRQPVVEMEHRKRLLARQREVDRTVARNLARQRGGLQVAVPVRQGVLVRRLVVPEVLPQEMVALVSSLRGVGEIGHLQFRV